ncbi:MAG TPA: hypothetical protein VNM37_04640 [Candidatus Dormibacteraeota bacterium]|nr:hypothetical protein [Candidatus Dormibacteraeota bacterium]
MTETVSRRVTYQNKVNPEKAQADRRRYYEENREAIREKSNAQYANDPEYRERQIEQQRLWRAKNPKNYKTDEHRDKMAAYREANREALRVYNREYRARKKAETTTDLP